MAGFNKAQAKQAEALMQQQDEDRTPLEQDIQKSMDAIEDIAPQLAAMAKVNFSLRSQVSNQLQAAVEIGLNPSTTTWARQYWHARN